MKIITELELRELFKEQPFESYRLDQSARMTPAATEFLNERKIMILDGAGRPALGSQHRRVASELSGMGACGVKNCAGESIKLEQTTHLKAGVLVLKNHKRIKFRGKLDSIQASLISLIITIEKGGESKVADELGVLLAYFRKMMRADVLDEPLVFLDFNGLRDAEIRERSHHPKKHYGIGHFTPDPAQGALMAGLNQLRCQIRELEIAGIEAFMTEEADCIERQDIILALNRLSSVVYIMMCQYLGGIYDQK